MERLDRDTTWIVRHTKPVSIDSLITDEVYSASGDTLVMLREVPSGMVLSGKREHKIQVDVAVNDTIMTKDSVVVLDGAWLPIKDDVRPDTNELLPLTMEAQVPTILFNTGKEVAQEAAKYPFNATLDSVYIGVLAVLTLHLLIYKVPSCIRAAMVDIQGH